MTPAPSDLLERKITRLRRAIWILSLILCVTVALSFVIVHALSRAYSEFNRLSPEERVKAASVIALGKYQKTGSTLKCIISEILKQDPNTKFYYKVGDEFPFGNQHFRENTDFGDGEILFFTGSPARLELATAYRGDRITGLGDMPLSSLREIAGDREDLIARYQKETSELAKRDLALNMIDAGVLKLYVSTSKDVARIFGTDWKPDIDVDDYKSYGIVHFAKQPPSPPPGYAAADVGWYLVIRYNTKN